jgi:2-polyprenyl-3-methyl-5-hydroxy-6-metoxy-1,4-benzoquinol methylase
MLPPNAHILDAGCGSGRDSKAFTSMGFRVTAIDASEEMVSLASQYSGLPVKLLRFQDLDFNEEFDAIWACASLLHVPRAEIDDVLTRLANAPKSGGIMYMSFKHGLRERTKNGRFFNDYTEESLHRQLARHPQLPILKL